MGFPPPQRDYMVGASRCNSFRRSQSESDFESHPSTSSESNDPLPHANADDEDSSHLSFLGQSFECRQKVEPWIRKNELTPDALPSRMQIRRGRSLGLAGSSVSIAEPNLRRGGSECQANATLHPPDSIDEDPHQWQQQTECGISFNISFSSTSEPSTNYQVSEGNGSVTPVGGRRSPSGSGTPRLERQEALGGWMETEPSLFLLTPNLATASGGSFNRDVN